MVHAACDFSVCASDQIAHFERNLLGSLRLMENCRKEGAQFIFISTGAVHEKILDDRPLDEAHPLWPASSYGAYKAAVEAFLPAYRESYGLNGSAFRPTSIYGIHLTDPTRSHWWGLVRQVLEGKRVDTVAGGKVVHVEDMAEAVRRAVGRDEVAGEAYELTDCHIYNQVVASFATEAGGVNTEIVTHDLAEPKYSIMCEKVRKTLGIDLNRDHAGVREYVGKLVSIIKKENRA